MMTMKNLFHSISILITVLYSATGADVVVYAQMGQTVTLKLPKETDAKSNYMYWSFASHNDDIAWSNHFHGWKYSEDGRWKNRLSVSDLALKITQLQQEDYGTFFFLKLNEQSQKIPVYKVILSKITVNKVPSSLLLAGESVSLDCNAETHNHRPNIYWVSPQKEKRDQRLNIKATSKDNGDWTCVVDGDEENKATTSVIVADLSPEPLHPRYTSKTSPLIIPCSILPHITMDQIKTRGIQEVYWQFFPKLSSGAISDESQRLFSATLNISQWKAEHSRGLNPVPDLNKGIFSLTRKQAKDDDSGDYKCVMKFKNDVTLTKTVHVEVLQIIAYPGMNLTSGQQVSLICSVGRGLSSDLRLKWIPPNTSLHPSLNSDPHSENFTIPEVSTADSGKWRCELWQGSTRLTSDVITLKIVYKLSVWMRVIICSVVAIIILLPILVFILYRHRQRKMRHPRHRLCQCKHPKPKGFYKT